MNLTVLLIAAFLPLPVMLFMILRSGSFGKGSIGAMLKLFFMGVASAVPAFLMEAGCLLVINVLLSLFPDNAFGGNLPIVSAVLRCFIGVALIEEGWKLFVLRTSTWKHMIMENITDGIAASALVGTGFSAVMYCAWQAAYYVVPADMKIVREAMPEYLGAGAVTAFIFTLLYIFSHFGYSGIMGAFYGIAKGSEQKEHNRRAGFMFFFSGLLPILLHGFCGALTGYGIAADKIIWIAIGLAMESIPALLMASMLGRASDAVGEDIYSTSEEQPVDFADSEEFAAFAESEGSVDPEGEREEEAGQDPAALPDHEILQGLDSAQDNGTGPDAGSLQDDDGAQDIEPEQDDDEAQGIESAQDDGLTADGEAPLDEEGTEMPV